ncbi:MAG: PAS domain-containing protein [Betaproteobacteria bacterium]
MPDAARTGRKSLSAGTELRLLRHLSRLSGIGAWQIDPANGDVLWTDALYRIFEIEPAQFVPGVDAMLTFLEPDDRVMLRQAMDRAIAEGTPWELELAARTARRRPIWLRVIGERLWQADGAVLLAGICEDVTPLCEQRDALHARSEEARKFAAVVETASTLVIITDPDGRIDWVNEAFTRVTGYSLLDVAGRQPAALLQDPADDATAFPRLAAGGGPTAGVELKLRRKDGSPYWARVELRPLCNDAGEIEHIVCAQEDITESKLAAQRASEAGDWLEVARVAAGIGFYFRASDSEELVIDEHSRAILGLTPEEPHLTLEQHLAMVLPADREQFVAMRTHASPEPTELEYRIRRRRDGAVRWVRALRVTLPAGERGSARILGAVIDITDLRCSDRQRRLLTERLALVSTAHDIGVWDLDIGTGNVQWNERMPVLYGIDAADAPRRVGEWLERFVFPADHERLVESLRTDQVAPNGQLKRRVEHRVVRGDGQLRWMESQATHVTGDDGRVLILGTSSDITDRKDSEQRLRDALQRLEIATERARVGIFMRDTVTRAGYWSPEMFQLYGMPEQAQAPSTEQVVERIHPDDRKTYLGLWLRAMQTDEFDDVQLRVVLPDGRLRWLMIRGRRETSATGGSLRMAGVTLDITAQKQAEAEAAASAAWLKLATETSGIGTWERDLVTGTGIWDPTMFRLMGLKPGSGVPARHIVDAMVHREDRASVLAARRHMQEVMHPIEYEYRMVRPDGTVAHINTRGVVLRDDAGQPVRAIGAAIDVTASRAAQRRLREFNEWLQLASGATGVAFFRLSLDDSTEYADRQMKSLYGFDPEGPTPGFEQLLSVIEPEDRERVLQVRMQSNTSDVPLETEYRVRLPDGKLRQIFTRRALLRDEGGQPLYVVGTAIDVTASRLVQAELQASNQRLALAQRTSGIGIWDWDVDRGTMTVDDVIRELLGVAADWVPDFERWMALVHPDDQAQARRVYDEALPSRRLDGRSEYRVVALDGCVRHIEERFTITRDASGRAVRLLGTNSDVTHARLAEREHFALINRLQLACQTANIGVWERQGDTEVWNVQMHAIYGTDATGQPSRSDWLARVHPDDRSDVERRLSEIDQQGGGAIEYRIVRGDGEIRKILDRCRIERDAHGCITRSLGVHLDITDIWRTQRERDELSSRVELIASSMGVGLWEWRLPVGQMTWSEQMFTLVGHDVPRSMGEWLALIHPEDRERSHASLIGVIKRGESMQLDYRAVWPDGSAHWLANQVRVERGPDGRAVRVFGVTWDITERKIAESALTAKEAAERASRAKTEFLSRMSHELRTPLNAILGFTQILEIDRSQPLSAVQRERIDHIKQAGWHLLTLINEILDLSRIEAGATALSMSVLSTREIVEEALKLIKTDAARRKLELSLEQQLDAPPSVWADRMRLKQVLLNLLSNAVKYNREGGSITVELRADAQGAAVIAVRDAGPGLEPAQVARLFEPFNRLGLEGSTIEGTGIGLTIVKKLAEQMGGSIAVLSEPGVGSEFSVTLQAASINTGETAAASLSGDGSTRVRTDVTGNVLCIEDNPANLAVVEAVLRLRPNVTLLRAPDGATARVLAAVCQPDVILVDMRLPDTDGMTLFRALRAQPKTARIPCVALSANALPSDIAAARIAGFSDYLTKPLSAAELLRTVDEVLDPQPQPQ